MICLIYLLFNSVLSDDNEGNNTPTKKRNSLIALPYAFYSPETKIAFGVGSIYSFRPAGADLTIKPSNLKIAATYTQRQQIVLSFVPEIYFRNHNYLYNGFYTYYNYPDKFWRFGNDTPSSNEENFTPYLLRTWSNLQKRIVDGFFIGLRYQFEWIDLHTTSVEGVLQLKDVKKYPGSEGGKASGLGVIFNYDTRNHVYFPFSGRYYQSYVVFFNNALASDYKFTLINVDLREYHIVYKDHVLALQSYNTFISGTPPFNMNALIGGSYWMRGYWLGRYRDKNMITAQAEYRVPLFWRIGAVGFIGGGDVASSIAKFEFNKFKYTAGFGIRFVFDKQEKINARLDFGFGSHGNSGVYAMVAEAF